MTNDNTQTNYDQLEPEPEDVSHTHDGRLVSSQPHDWTISTLREKYDRGLIDLQPHYQREYVWSLKPELPSRLIESLLLQIPIPPLYFVQLDTGKLEVVDGQQRLTTLMQYISNGFVLQKLQRLSNFNGKYFRDLPEREQERIRDASIHSIVIDAGLNYELRYEIFERLNRGTMVLNEQEIRNCAYRGPFCDLLAKLDKDPNWRRVKGGSEPEPRFIEREMILRFFAFAERLEHYGGSLKRFLNAYMGQYAPKQASRIDELKSVFCQTMNNVYTVFGENSAQLYTVKEGQQISDGNWESKFSISALDIQASSLIGYPSAKLQAVAPRIKEAYKYYLTTNPNIRDAISRQPARTEATKIRWIGFKAVVQEILNGASKAGNANDPLADAGALYRLGHHMAAGAMAGVVLENHLKKLYQQAKPGIEMGKLTLNPLDVKLREAGIYDLTTSKKVTYLADIRNRCDHATDKPPEPKDISDLIAGVRNLIHDYPLS